MSASSSLDEADPAVWFPCRFCKRAFRDKKQLMAHKTSNHAVKLREYRARKSDPVNSVRDSGSPNFQNDDEFNIDSGADQLNIVDALWIVPPPGIKIDDPSEKVGSPEVKSRKVDSALQVHKSSTKLDAIAEKCRNLTRQKQQGLSSRNATELNVTAATQQKITSSIKSGAELTSPVLLDDYDGRPKQLLLAHTEEDMRSRNKLKNNCSQDNQQKNPRFSLSNAHQIDKLEPANAEDESTRGDNKSVSVCLVKLHPEKLAEKLSEVSPKRSRKEGFTMLRHNKPGDDVELLSASTVSLTRSIRKKNNRTTYDAYVNTSLQHNTSKNIIKRQETKVRRTSASKDVDTGRLNDTFGECVRVEGESTENPQNIAEHLQIIPEDEIFVSLERLTAEEINSATRRSSRSKEGPNKPCLNVEEEQCANQGDIEVSASLEGTKDNQLEPLSPSVPYPNEELDPSLPLARNTDSKPQIVYSLISGIVPKIELVSPSDAYFVPTIKPLSSSVATAPVIELDSPMIPATRVKQEPLSPTISYCEPTSPYLFCHDTKSKFAFPLIPVNKSSVRHSSSLVPSSSLQPASMSSLASNSGDTLELTPNLPSIDSDLQSALPSAPSLNFTVDPDPVLDRHSESTLAIEPTGESSPVSVPTLESKSQRSSRLECTTDSLPESQSSSLSGRGASVEIESSSGLGPEKIVEATLQTSLEPENTAESASSFSVPAPEIILESPVTPLSKTKTKIVLSASFAQDVMVEPTPPCLVEPEITTEIEKSLACAPTITIGPTSSLPIPGISTETASSTIPALEITAEPTISLSTPEISIETASSSGTALETVVVSNSMCISEAEIVTVAEESLEPNPNIIDESGSSSLPLQGNIVETNSSSTCIVEIEAQPKSTSPRPEPTTETETSSTSESVDEASVSILPDSGPKDAQTLENSIPVINQLRQAIASIPAVLSPNADCNNQLVPKCHCIASRNVNEDIGAQATCDAVNVPTSNTTVAPESLTSSNSTSNGILSYPRFKEPIACDILCDSSKCSSSPEKSTDAISTIARHGISIINIQNQSIAGNSLHRQIFISEILQQPRSLTGLTVFTRAERGNPNVGNPSSTALQARARINIEKENSENLMPLDLSVRKNRLSTLVPNQDQDNQDLVLPLDLRTPRSMMRYDNSNSIDGTPGSDTLAPLSVQEKLSLGALSKEKQRRNHNIEASNEILTREPNASNSTSEDSHSVEIMMDKSANESKTEDSFTFNPSSLKYNSSAKLVLNSEETLPPLLACEGYTLENRAILAISTREEKDCNGNSPSQTDSSTNQTKSQISASLESPSSFNIAQHNETTQRENECSSKITSSSSSSNSRKSGNDSNNFCAIDSSGITSTMRNDAESLPLRVTNDEINQLSPVEKTKVIRHGVSSKKSKFYRYKCHLCTQYFILRSVLTEHIISEHCCRIKEEVRKLDDLQQQTSDSIITEDMEASHNRSCMPPTTSHANSHPKATANQPSTTPVLIIPKVKQSGVRTTTSKESKGRILSETHPITTDDASHEKPKSSNALTPTRYSLRKRPFPLLHPQTPIKKVSLDRSATKLSEKCADKDQKRSKAACESVTDEHSAVVKAETTRFGTPDKNIATKKWDTVGRQQSRKSSVAEKECLKVAEFKCDHCPKLFETRKSRGQHSRVHTAGHTSPQRQRPTALPTEPRSLSSSNNSLILNSNEVNPVEPEGDRNQKNSSPNNVTGENRKFKSRAYSIPKLSFRCKICAKVCKTNACLSQHERVHQTVSPFQFHISIPNSEFSGADTINARSSSLVQNVASEHLEDQAEASHNEVTVGAKTLVACDSVTAVLASAPCSQEHPPTSSLPQQQLTGPAVIKNEIPTDEPSLILEVGQNNTPNSLEQTSSFAGTKRKITRTSSLKSYRRVKPLECKICGKRCARPCNLQNHMKMHTEGSVVSDIKEEKSLTKDSINLHQKKNQKKSHSLESMDKTPPSTEFRRETRSKKIYM